MKFTFKSILYAVVAIIFCFSSNSVSASEKIPTGFHYEMDQNNRPYLVKDLKVKEVSVWERLKQIAPEKKMSSGVVISSTHSINEFFRPIKKTPTDLYSDSYEGENKILPILSLVLGILSIIFFWFIYLGLPFAFAAILCGIFGLKNEKYKDIAVAGIICGAISILLLLTIIVFLIALLSAI